MKNLEVKHHKLTEKELHEIIQKLRETISKMNKVATQLRVEKEKLAVVMAESIYKIKQLKKGHKYYSLEVDNFYMEFLSIKELIQYCLDNGVDPNSYITINDKITSERLEDHLIE